MAPLGLRGYPWEVRLTDDAVTLTVLREIRDEIRSTNDRLDQTRVELTAQLDQTRVELSGRLANLEGAMGELAQQQAFVVRWLKAGSRRDRRLERDVIKLTERVDAMEARLPVSEE